MQFRKIAGELPAVIHFSFGRFPRRDPHLRAQSRLGRLVMVWRSTCHPCCFGKNVKLRSVEIIYLRVSVGFKEMFQTFETNDVHSVKQTMSRNKCCMLVS